MPYRRLPNTDEARMRAITTALRQAESVLPKDIAFSQAEFVRLRNVTQNFNQILITHRQSYKTRVQSNINYQESFKKTKLYVSHFIQVLNMCIARNEIPKTARKLFGIGINDKTVPNITSEEMLLEWGKIVLEGEKERVTKGGIAIYNPKIAIVKVEYDKFYDLFHYQKTLREIHDRASAKLDEYRKEVDDVILNIWNETESHFEKISPELKREFAGKYGIVYVYRKKEKQLRQAV